MKTISTVKLIMEYDDNDNPTYRKTITVDEEILPPNGERTSLKHSVSRNIIEESFEYNDDNRLKKD